MKFQIKRSSNNKFYFMIKARNGETVATSEMYESKQACKKGIWAVKKSLFASIVDLTLEP